MAELMRHREGQLTEEWKPVEGFEGLYLVSNLGKIYSIRNKTMLKPLVTRAGYNRVHLSVDGKVSSLTVHRIVAKAFVPNPEGKPTVNHKNEIKADNRAENLEWMTNKEQNIYGTRIDRAREHTDYKSRNIDYASVASKHDYKRMGLQFSKSVYQMDLSGNILFKHSGITAASKKTGINAGKICECAQGKRKAAGGFVWQYVG